MSLQHEADALLRKATDAGDVPGVVAMATTREGNFYEGAFGVRILGRSDAMTADSVCRLASMTKAITATAAMQLVEQGRLELAGPAARWVPQLAEAQVLEGFDAAGRPRLRPPRQPITLRHLLTHTAGFAYEHWSADIVRAQQALGLPGMGTCKLAALRAPLLFDPGERWNYGIGIDWVGQAIEAVSGMKLGAYLREHVLGPLGMHDTAFRISPAMRKRLAKVHQRHGDGSLEPLLASEVPQEPEFEMGGGGLYGTAGDYCRFVRMILNEGRGEGGPLLRPETVRSMARNHIGDLSVRMLESANPMATNDAEMFPGLRKTWSLAFQINMEAAPTGRSAGSLSWAGLANTYYWIDPARGIGGVYLSQVLPFVDVKSYPLFLAFESAVYRSLA
ncbi:MAG TPA: serine hydrolase domain-containing protein [bacterium]